MWHLAGRVSPMCGDVQMWRSPWSFSPPCVLCTKILDLAQGSHSCSTQDLRKNINFPHLCCQPLLPHVCAAVQQLSFVPPGTNGLKCQLKFCKVRLHLCTFFAKMLHWLLSTVVRELFIYPIRLTVKVWSPYFNCF